MTIMSRAVTLLLQLAAVLGGIQARLFIVQNNLQETIHVGALGKAGKTSPNNGGWTLAPGQQTQVWVEETWSGRFWARTGCNFDELGYGYCETGDCGNRLQCAGAAGAAPATLAEIALNSWQGQDVYDVSNVEGFNVPIQIAPLVSFATAYEPYRCGTAGCSVDLLATCPTILRQYNRSGKVVGCKSACVAFNADHFCCRGLYSDPQNCDPSRWPINYPLFFKNNCPAAYSYTFDDATSAFYCAQNGFRITFG